MEIVSTAVYVGPNVYAKQPLIRLTVDLHRRADKPVSDYADALGPLFDAAARPRHRRQRARHAPPRAARRTPDCHLGELMAQVAIALQNRAGAPAEVAMTRPAAHADEVEVLYGYESEEIGLEAGEVARAIILELIAPATTTSPPTSPRPSPTSTISPAAARSAPPRWRWSAPPRPATSPGCASTTPASSRSARASTRSASRRR